MTGVGSARGFVTDFMQQRIVVDGTRTRNLEGFLFPSTYLVPLGASPQASRRADDRGVLQGASARRPARCPQPARYRPAGGHGRVARGAGSEERESIVRRSRKSSTIGLRLECRCRSMRRSSTRCRDTKAQLSFADLKIDSPYNTYQRVGLPPTPIANPGRPVAGGGLPSVEGPRLLLRLLRERAPRLR